jgi:hypothetical protein
MLRITRIANGGVIFKLSGRIETENIAELEALLSGETSGRSIFLDLSEITLVDQDVVSFLRHSEVDGIKLKNCPAYVREWMKQEKAETATINALITHIRGRYRMTRIAFFLVAVATVAGVSPAFQLRGGQHEAE